MATIDSASVIRQILQNNGTYPGDPQLHCVLSYTNDWGHPTFAICTNEVSYIETALSPWVRNPVHLWSRESGLTKAGHEFLLSFEEESE